MFLILIKLGIICYLNKEIPGPGEYIPLKYIPKTNDLHYTFKSNLKREIFHSKSNKYPNFMTKNFFKRIKFQI